MVGGVVALLVIERAFAVALLDPWNTWVAMLPFALAVVLTWSVWCRDWWALPVLVAVLSFSVQSHVGYALLAVWLLGSAVAAVVWSHWAARRHDYPRAPCPRRVSVTAAVVLVVAWALPLIGQLRQDPGNLRLIVDYFRNHADASVGLGRALGLVARQVGVNPPWLGGPDPVEGFSGAGVGASVLWLVPLVVVFVATLVIAARAVRHTSPERAGPARDAVRFQALLAGTAVVGWISVSRITGEPFPYLMRWLWVVGAFGWLASAWSAWTAWSLRREADARTTDDPWAPRVPFAIASVVVVATTLWASLATVDAPLRDQQFADAVAALIGPTADAVRANGTLVLAGDGSTWHEVQNGLLAELERQGLRVYVDNDGAFVYGTHRTIGDRPVDGRLVVAVNEAVDARRARGEVPIATYDPLSAEQRDRLLDIRRRYDAQLRAESTGQTVADPITADDSAFVQEVHDRGDLVAVYLERP
jgi:hypothetical protein